VPTVLGRLGSGMSVSDWGRSEGINFVILHDYYIVTCFCIFMLIVRSTLLLITKKWLIRVTSMYRTVRVNRNLEFAWTVVPMVVLVFLGYPSLCALYGAGINDCEKDIRLKAIGNQWY